MVDQQQIQEVGDNKAVSLPAYTHEEEPAANTMDHATITLTPEDVCTNLMPMSCLLLFGCNTH